FECHELPMLSLLPLCHEVIPSSSFRCYSKLKVLQIGTRAIVIENQEPYEDLDDKEEDLKEDPEMDLDEEEEDPKMDVDDEEEEEPLPASPPPLSPLRTPPPVSESSSGYDISFTTNTTVGRPFKGPLSTYEVGKPSSIASASVFSTRYELNQLRHDFGILGRRVQSLTREIRLEVASVDRYRLEWELYSVRAQMHAIQQELYWRGFEENHPTESIDVLATYGDADPPELQEPSDTQ
ncbi:hypothetical protein Tco_0495835, partial [Tanacetum coccineum]